MIKLDQVRKAIRGNPAVDQVIDFDGDEGFLLVLNDGFNWEYGDPGCHTRGWSWDDEQTIADVKADLKDLVQCDGSCGSEDCQTMKKRTVTKLEQETGR